MIKDNSLADKLNTIKTGAPHVEEAPRTLHVPEKKAKRTKLEILKEFLTALSPIIDPFIYGWSLSLILSLDLSILPLFVLGLFTSKILDFTSKTKLFRD